MRRLAGFCFVAFSVCAQNSSVIDWLTALQLIESRLTESPSQRTAVGPELQSLDREIRAWVSSSSNSIDLPALPQSAAAQELLSYVKEARNKLEDFERNRPGSPFYLGRIEVNVAADATQVPTATTIDESEYRERNLKVIPDALNLIPGVSIQRIGARNERGVFVRGFDVRQVPLYIDGIPVYVPYDGYVDMDRFLTYDVGEMQVSKGFTSPLYRPNAIGGAINLITKAPTKPFNLDMGTGNGSGSQAHGFANAGVKWRELGCREALPGCPAIRFRCPGIFGQ